jgi:hypothetical protein
MYIEIIPFPFISPRKILYSVKKMSGRETGKCIPSNENELNPTIEIISGGYRLERWRRPFLSCVIQYC